MNHQVLAELINAPDRITTLSTVGEDGAPNAAVIGSAFLAGDDELWVGLGDNRTARNLKATRSAVLLVMRPGDSVLAWQGVRVYLELTAMETEGERFARIVERIETTAGRMAARTIRQVAVLQISAVRPLMELSPR